MEVQRGLPGIGPSKGKEQRLPDTSISLFHSCLTLRLNEKKNARSH